MVRLRMTKDERKEQIQEASIALFLEKGFKNTTMDDIRKTTNLSAGGLYHHYRNTYEIMYDIMVNGNLLREDIINHSLEQNERKIDARFLAEILTDKMLADNKYIPLYVMFLCEAKNDDKLMELFVRLKDMTINNYTKLIESLSYRAPSRKEFEFIANLINSVLLGGEILSARENLRENREVLIKMLESYFLKIEKE